MVWSWVTKKVAPSAGEALRIWAAIWPPAPGLFSTTTEVPRLSFILSASRRAITSVPPPGGKPTNSRTGLPLL